MMIEFLQSMELYNFAKGPMVWLAFLVFIGGAVFRLYTLLSRVRGAKAIFPYVSLKYSLRSILHWVIPFASTNMRNHPWMTLITFSFHISLFVTPVFLLAHIMLWQEAWKISWWSLSETAADLMTITVILCCAFFAIRRAVAPEVRFVTFASDYILLATAAAPFITGFLAFHQLFFDYKVMLNLHILCGEVMLMAIPFTRLVHMLFFWLTRAYTGSEFGAVRHTRDF
jgi:nitrate reductase gamma subunit